MTSETGGNAGPAGSVGLRNWWLIAVLTLLYTFSFLDRHIITLMVDPIRKSLGISEVQIGLLQGFSFALFFGIAGVPLGIAADRMPRRKLIFIGAVAWTFAAASAGLASRYWQLLVTRMGVGVAEATLLPAGYSLIGSTFPKRRLGLAVSIFSSGSIIGGAAAVFLGALIIGSLPPGGVDSGVLGHFEPWQAAFVIAAAPCLLVAPLIFTVPGGNRPPPQPGQSGFGPAFAEMRRYPDFYVGHFLGAGLISFCGFSATSWIPTYLMRSLGMSVVEVGSWLGALSGFLGLLGTVFLGWVADLWFRNGRTDAHVLTPLVAGSMQFIALTAAMLSSGVAACLFFLAAYYLFVGFHGSAAAALQIAAPPHLRGRISALYLLTFILLGAGAGPFATASINEWIMPDTSRLNVSIILASAAAMPVLTGCLLLAARGLRRIEAERAAA